MSGKESILFPGFTFSGYVKKMSPEDVTLGDKGQFPYSQDLLHMIYKSENVGFEVNSSEEFGVEIRGAVDKRCKDITSSLWQQSTRELFSSIEKKVSHGIEALQTDEETFARNPVITQEPFWINRFEVVYLYNDFSKEADTESILRYLTSLEHMDSVEITNTDDGASKIVFPNGVRLNVFSGCTGMSLAYHANQHVTQDVFEKEISEYGPEEHGFGHDKNNPHLRNLAFVMSFNKPFFRVPFIAFEEDVKQLEVKPYGQRS